MNPTKTESIARFLLNNASTDLAQLYTPDMEVQVLVAQDGGQRVESEYKGRPWQGWTDGFQTWKAFRIPRNANTIPSFEDTVLGFDLAVHAEAVGMTGWDWRNGLSRWVAFDFDAITGHSEKHGRKLTDQQLTEIKDSLNEIEWVTLRKSTGGKGLHVYVFLEPVATANHTEHAALARAILGKISSLTKSELETKVDICGQNMWVWHRKITKEAGGLSVLKPGTVLTEIPPHWRDHIKVVTGHRRKVLPRFFGEDDSPVEQKFDELHNQITKVPLDESHKKLIAYLEDKATGSSWDADHHMLITHTYWLMKAHEDLKFRGIFKTNSIGSEAPSDVNAYLFPNRNGSWAVRRYSIGVQEDVTWEQDGRGWTRCYLNADPSLQSAARVCAGDEDPSGGFYFNEAELALDTIRMLGGEIPDLPLALRTQKAKVKEHKDGRLVIEIEGDERQIMSSDMKGWLYKNKKWVKIVNAKLPQKLETEVGSNDDAIRHLVTSANNDAGWALRGENAEWRHEPLVHVSNVLHTMGMNATEIKSVIGHSVLRAWKLVNLPFQPEYPGDRLWNEQGAKLRFLPSQNETREYSHWKMILDHIGASLTPALANDPWAQNNGIVTGGDYLKVWAASMFQFPLEPLPYLFLYGPQNSGKSIFHEALALLFDRGYKNAKDALQNTATFNGELANAVLCYVDEIELRRDKIAANRIKEWVTARELSIHPKGGTPYMVANSSHWVQTSNTSTACPILPGDTRITSIHVDSLDPMQMIPKRKMVAHLEQEAPDFLAELLQLEIPPANDRLNVPVIRTAEKMELEAFNRTAMELFLAEKCHQVDGEFELYSSLYDSFLAYLDPGEVAGWTKQKFGRELPPNFPKGRERGTSHWIVGNITLKSPDGLTKKTRFVASAPDKHNNVFLDGGVECRP